MVLLLAVAAFITTFTSIDGGASALPVGAPVGAMDVLSPARVSAVGPAPGPAPVGTIEVVSRNLLYPAGIVAGPGGDLWFTNFGNATVGRLTVAGALTTYELPGVDGPSGIAVGPDGNVWFTNNNGDSIGRITPAGVVTNYTSSSVLSPKGITAGPDGNLWFANTGNNSIGRITPAGVITKYTGTGISNPVGITKGPDGNLWFTNIGNKSLGRITPTGAVTNYTNPGINQPEGITAGADGNLWFTNFAGDSIGRVTPGGVVSTYSGSGVDGPKGIASGPDGNLWFTNYANNSIGRITPTGTLTNYTGPGLANPSGITQGPDGDLWFTNEANSSIGRVTPAGTVSFKGSAVTEPRGITAGPDGNMWFTNNGNNTIGRITPARSVTTFGGSPVINSPREITASTDGTLWFTQGGDHGIGTIAPTTGYISTLDIGGPAFDIAAGPGGFVWVSARLTSKLSPPFNITFDAVAQFKPTLEFERVEYQTCGCGYADGIVAPSDGSVWFTRQLGNSIGRFNSAFKFDTFPLPAEHTGQSRITEGPDGNLWFTHAGSNSIGRITPTGAITHYTGTGISAPNGIAAGPDGNLWFTNQGNSSIGRITTAGVVTNYPAPAGAGLNQIVAGPGGKLWFTNTELTNAYVATIVAVPQTTVPDAPTAVRATAGNGQATVQWTAPVSDGNAPITAYTVTSAPGGKTCVRTTGPLSCVVTGLTNGQNYTFTVKATNGVGPGPPSAPSAAVRPVSGMYFHALAPTRILDSRGPTGGWNARLQAGTPRNLTVSGGSGPVPAGAEAVVVNVTATGGSANSFLTVYPAGSAVPVASNVNFAVGETIPNLATVKVGTNGQVSVANAVGSVDVIVDVVGYYDNVPAERYTPMSPTRILDSRGAVGGWNAPVAAGAPKTLQIRGVSAIPATANAVVANVTVTGGTANSFLTVYPAGGAVPAASNVNYAVGQTIPNLVTVKIGANGQIAVATNAGSVHVIVDVVGYYDPTTGDVFHPLNPARILDSRSVQGGWNARLAAGSPRALTTTGVGGVTLGATAIVGNVTVTGGSTNSFLTLYPTGTALPNASNLNYAVGQTVPNLTIVKTGTSGSINFATAAGSVDVIYDTVGYFTAT